jgi:hypothetical protein
MLIQSLMRLRSRRALLRNTFRKSQASYLEFVATAEQCALRLSPDFKLAWQNVYQLQRLLKEQQSIRFEYLLKVRHLDCSRFESLDAIVERLDAGWTDAEESALRTLDARYNKISLEIADIRSKWKPYAVGQSFKTLENDPEYQIARLALSSRAKEFAERVKR